MIADASGHGKGPDSNYDHRRGGREKRGHRGSRRDHDRERERDRDRERDLDQDGANQFASRFQSIEEVLGQVITLPPHLGSCLIAFNSTCVQIHGLLTLHPMHLILNPV